MSEMEVSVIIPTKDRPGLLVEAVQSLTVQTRHPDEVVIVNDGSDISYEEAYKQIQDLPIHTKIYRNNQSRGANYSRNRGAKEATGDVLMFLDDDDIWFEQKVQNQLKILSNSQDVGVVYTGKRAINENSQELFSIPPGPEGDLSNSILIKNHLGSTSSVAIRKNLFEKVDGFDTSLIALQDWELWIRVCQITNVKHDDRCSVGWRIHDDRSEQKTGDFRKYLHSHEQVHQKHAALYDLLNPLEKLKYKSYKHNSVLAKIHTGHYARRLYHLSLSFTTYPNVACIANALPNNIYTKLRKYVNN